MPTQKPLKRVAVTGGAGQIAYSLLFRIAHGDLLGADQPIALHILEIPEALKSLEGVVMELEDCAFPLLKEVRFGSKASEIFKDINYALLVGAKPRGPGMERAELLSENGKIFIEQGRALNDSAADDVKVLVVGNPCNTNCLIALSNAPRIPRKNFHAMMRLDQNRAQAQLARKSGVGVDEVSQVAIWGNHSTTQVPAYQHAKIKGKSAQEVITEAKWFNEVLVPTVQKRGAEVIAARGKSSAASAANAAIEQIRELLRPTPPGHWFSSAVWSNGNPYGIEENLIFSFPCRSKGDGDYEIVPNLPIDAELREKLKASETELIQERSLVMDALGSKK